MEFCFASGAARLEELTSRARAPGPPRIACGALRIDPDNTTFRGGIEFDVSSPTTGFAEARVVFPSLHAATPWKRGPGALFPQRKTPMVDRFRAASTRYREFLYDMKDDPLSPDLTAMLRETAR